MPVITISRGTLSGATAIAERVAKELDVPCVNREMIAESALRAGISPEIIGEKMEHGPSFLNRHSHERDVYLWHVRSELCRYATEGSFVYEGHCGHLLLADMDNVLRVRILAPMASRVAALVEDGVDPQKAEDHINRMDKWRKQWTHHLYGVDWDDPGQYDLVINLARLDVLTASNQIVQAARVDRYAWTPENKQNVADVALATSVASKLASGGELFLGEFELTAHANVLTIHGLARPSSQENIRAAAQAAAGNAELHVELSPPPSLLERSMF